ncbi:MAG: hypothetical protein HeimC3_47980 [Candidatus Heimdallarchaeota archaeon LC_3]|nr:MAG: hypothetical protein HeimC3_47980 [Candidatus Heimdallarchaeota archaeon LC_3]
MKTIDFFETVVENIKGRIEEGNIITKNIWYIEDYQQIMTQLQ